MQILPLVSVLMTAYNREKYIAEAIESVINQTYQNWELIIVDDCSKDNTVSIAKKYAATDNRILVYVNEKNLGDYPNRNKAASYAKGEFLMFVDSDDSIKSDAIEYIFRWFTIFKEAKHSTICYHGAYQNPTFLPSNTAINVFFEGQNILSAGPGARVFKTSFFNEIGGFPTKYGPVNDLYFNIYSTSYSPILLLPYEYLNYRIHENQEKNNVFGYLFNGYICIDEVLALEIVPLPNQYKTTIRKKNKHRFIVNCIKLLFKSFEVKKIYREYKKANIYFSDLF